MWKFWGMVKMVFGNIHSIHFKLLDFFIVHHLHSNDYHKAEPETYWFPSCTL